MMRAGLDLQPGRALPDFQRDRVVGAHEGRDERRRRAVIDLLGRADLRDAALIHHHDAVRHGHGFLAIMRHMQHRETKPALQRLDLAAQLKADLGVEIGQWLVEQQQPRLDRERAAKRDALTLAARQSR